MASSGNTAVAPVIGTTAAWAWRLLVVLLAAAVAYRVIATLHVIFVPLALALILTALLMPAVDRLTGWGAPRTLAVGVVLLGILGGVGGIVAFVASRLIDGFPELVDRMSFSVDSVRHWLTDGPLHLSKREVDMIGDSAIAALRQHQARLTGGLITTATTITEIVAGFLVTVFALACFLHSGHGIYRFVTRIFPKSVRDRVRAAGVAGFGSLAGYVRATLFVALVDALGIGLALFAMGVPLALPLASLVFLGAFVPVVGAVVTGLLAVLVALLTEGWLLALLTLAVVVAVQQIEGNVLQPLVVGRAVSLHPLAVLLTLTAGGIIAGVAGMLLAVPALAFTDRAIRSHQAQSRRDPEPPDTAGDEPLVSASPAPDGCSG